MKVTITVEVEITSWEREREWFDTDEGEFFQDHFLEVDPDEKTIKEELPKFFMHLNSGGGCMINGMNVQFLSAKVE